MVTSILEPPMMSVEVTSSSAKTRMLANKRRQEQKGSLTIVNERISETADQLERFRTPHVACRTELSGLGGSEVLCLGRAEKALEQGVQAKLAGAEDQDDQGGDEEDVGSGRVEFVGVGEDGLQRFAVGGDVGHDHVHGEDQGGQPGQQSDGQENPAEEFHAGDEHRHLRGHGQIQAGEELGDLRKIMQLAPAALDQLPAPIQAYGKQKRRTQVIDASKKTLVKPP